LLHGRHYDDLFQKRGIGDRRFGFCDLRQTTLPISGVPVLQAAALARSPDALGDLGDLDLGGPLDHPRFEPGDAKPKFR
jgi:hypothetical protein